jgi:hypothetical protein
MFQIITDLSPLQLASLEPSGLKQTPKTQPECPFSVHLQEPVTTSHRRTMLSMLPEAMTVPSGEKATALTPALHNHSNS